MNPVEWTKTTAPMNTEQVLLFRHMIEDIKPEVCYGEQILGLDVCLSGRYIKPVTPHAPVFPFCGPSKFNISIKPGKIQPRR
ncbi:hypothetical protein OS493_034983 [Desmophyllum pertusum]|uniref:Uncharacterized protein n=1 Tax=Desmophyllum pertusum TaxID=174260 RepID=A0A9X0CCU1_9CNID|nr:hypothetical protein OS493_034983 [Desmophyllum pertusum]